jgi:hypothetical protein
MLVLAVSPQGTVYLGRFYFGIWNDVLPPVKVLLKPKQSIALRATLGSDHVLKLSVNNQAVEQFTLDNNEASTFGLFGLTGQHGGLNAQFTHLVVSHFNQ